MKLFFWKKTEKKDKKPNDMNTKELDSKPKK